MNFIVKCEKSKAIIEEFTHLFGDFYLPPNYSRLLPPNDGQQKNPLEIAFEIESFDIIEVDDMKFTITLQMYLVVRWEDSRIIKIGGSLERSGEQIALDPELTKTIWSPDIDVYGLRKATDFKVLSKYLAGTERMFK